MESSVSLQGLPLAQNIQAKSELKFRPGQINCACYIERYPDQGHYVFVLPTGYGKSITALICYDMLRMLGVVNKMLIIVPTDTQRSQYKDDLLDDADNINCEINGIDIWEGVERNYNTLRRENCEVYVTTAAMVQSKTSAIADFMDRPGDEWLIIADEFQKFSEEQAWGKAIFSLPKERMIGLTATPIRSDGVATIFGAGLKPHVEVTLEKAYEEQACRGVRTFVDHYDIQVITQDGKEIIIPTAEVQEAGDIDQYLTKKGLRENENYLANIIQRAIDCYDRKSMRYPEQHRLLIFAMNQEHCRVLKDLITTCFDLRADWIGESRAKEINNRVITAFKSGETPCLIQVDKASEGFNCKQASVLVFLNILSKNTVKARQQIGRGLRRNQAIENFDDDICDIFCTPDTDLHELAIEYAERTVGPIKGVVREEKGKAGDRQPKLGPYPEQVVVDATFRKSERYQRFMNDPDYTEWMANKWRKNIMEVDKENFQHTPHDEIIAAMIEFEEMKYERQQNKLLATQTGEGTKRNDIQKVVGQLSGFIGRKFFPQWKENKRYFGIACSVIHSIHGGLSHDAMVPRELDEKLSKLKDLWNHLRDDGDLPHWIYRDITGRMGKVR